MTKKEKVIAYIYREYKGALQVLVFDHPNVPEVNPQVPAGTLEENEKPQDGILREILEESGLKFDAVENYLGQFEYIADYKNEIHKRHVFSFMTSGLPDSWSHHVKSHDEDNGEVFDFYWLPLEVAKEKLVVDLGKYLPTGNGHFVNTTEIQAEWFNEELKIGGVNSNISKYFGLKKVAAQYFEIPSGFRSSEPHAESLEEEFVFVISGQVDLWLNGKIKKMNKGDCIGFPAGTGVGHCFINNSDRPCEIFVSGDRTKADNQYHFHLDQSLETECGDKWWTDMPKQILGKHDGLPGEFDSSLIDNEIKIFNGLENLPSDSYSYPNDSETFTNGVCLSRRFGMINVAVWLERIPVGKRTSWPHAHSVEEEFVFVLEGNPKVRLNGKEYEAKPLMGIDFKAGSGVSHTLINKSDTFIYYLCVGECESKNDKIFYPEHPKRNEEMKKENALWEEMVANE
jgi:uncharacterized cupin superfamily protein/8-oxo-dGTP pyrophosphatase MutT (NUDIX family)